MKVLLFVIFTILTASAEPGDKGNVVKSKPGDKGNIVSPLMGDKGNILPQDFETNYHDGYYGGDAVVCRRDNQIVAANLIDYIEADKIIRRIYTFENIYTDFNYVTMLANKLERAAPEVFTSFRREAQRLAIAFNDYSRGISRQDVRFVKKLPQVHDNGRRNEVRTNLKNCKIEQLMIRQKLFTSVQYDLNVEIFKHLSPRDRRGLIIHEAIYHVFNMYYGDDNSARTRFFNRRLIQQPLRELSRDMIIDYLKMAYVYY